MLFLVLVLWLLLWLVLALLLSLLVMRTADSKPMELQIRET